jgi:shikimate dehydrogenase
MERAASQPQVAAARSLQMRGAAARGAAAMGFAGFNLTIPHKVAIFDILDRITPEAEVMGAVNTVSIEEGRLAGTNTDGKGFMTALRGDGGTEPRGKACVVMGAGGAARAITVELALAGARSILVVNRDAARGEALVRLLRDRANAQASFAPWTPRYRLPEGAEVVVNATSIGLFPDVDARPDLDYDSIERGMVVCDVIPNPPRTPFLREAERRGARTLDGLGMLVYQGVIGYELWTGREAPISVMKAALAREFGGS